MIFLDTGFLYALVTKRDENHQRVLDVMDELRDRDLRTLAPTANNITEALTVDGDFSHRFTARPGPIRR